MEKIFRKKPVEVMAVQFRKPMFGNHTAYLRSIGADYYQPSDVVIGGKGHGEQRFTPRPYYAIKTLEGWMEITDGDWIITGVKGEKYPCKPDIFDLTYEEIPANETRYATDAIEQQNTTGDISSSPHTI